MGETNSEATAVEEEMTVTQTRVMAMKIKRINRPIQVI